VKVLCKYLELGRSEEFEEREVLDDEIVSSNPVEVERATDLVLCEDVRSCAIDYAIRRDSWMETIESGIVGERH
jgi:hypothetical protein